MKTIIKKAFSPMEVAKMLGVSHATIYREMNRGRLSSVKVGTRRVITQWDLEEYLGKERARALLEDISNEKATQTSEAAEQDRLARIDTAMGMFAAGDIPETILAGYPWLEPEDIQACLIYARRQAS